MLQIGDEEVEDVAESKGMLVAQVRKRIGQQATDVVTLLLVVPTNAADAAPVREMMRRLISMMGKSRNRRRGRLTSDASEQKLMSDGQTVTFMDGAEFAIVITTRENTDEELPSDQTKEQPPEAPDQAKVETIVETHDQTTMSNQGEDHAQPAQG